MSTNKIIIFLLILIIGLATFAEAQNIVYITREDDTYWDPNWENYSEYPFLVSLEGAGYTITKMYSSVYTLSAASQATLDTLNNADLVIMGRSIPSDMTDGDDKPAWNSITAPVLNLSLWSARSNRMNWFDSSAATNIDDEVSYYAKIVMPEDPVFDGIDVSGDVPWCEGPASFEQETDAGNGIVLARESVNLWVLFVRWEPGIEFYDGSVDMPAGPRSLIGNGNDNLRDGDAHIFNFWNFTPESEQVFLAEVARMVNPTSIEDKQLAAPTNFSLDQNYPNPFNPTTTISYHLPTAENVALTVYDVLGNKIKTLINDYQVSGQHQVTWNGKDENGFNVASGIYVYRINVGNSILDRKMLLLK